MPYASAGGGPRIELASEGLRMRLWPLGGKAPPLTGVPLRFIGGPRMDMPLFARGMSPPTNRGKRRSSSVKTSAARSRNRGWPSEDSLWRAWFLFGWNIFSGRRKLGGRFGAF